MTRDNPFPGMNPYLERHWPDVHTKLIAYIADAIAESLPPDLSARAEERVILHDGEGGGLQMRADVAVSESWKAGVAPSWDPVEASAGDDAEATSTVATQPQIVVLDQETERWIEISDHRGSLVTVVEVLSPSNKGSARSRYLARRDRCHESGVNLVEIDLLRGGEHVLSVPLGAVRRPPGTAYLVCVSRASDPGLLEVYATGLREALPVIRVPLRPDDADAVLALQPLVDRCYRMGGYWNLDLAELPGPAFDGEEATWVEERLREAGLGSA